MPLVPCTQAGEPAQFYKEISFEKQRVRDFVLHVFKVNLKIYGEKEHPFININIVYLFY